MTICCNSNMMVCIKEKSPASTGLFVLILTRSELVRLTETCFHLSIKSNLNQAFISLKQHLMYNGLQNV